MIQVGKYDLPVNISDIQTRKAPESKIHQVIEDFVNENPNRGLKEINLSAYPIGETWPKGLVNDHLTDGHS